MKIILIVTTKRIWLRGSFHGHCVEHSACASIPLAESVANYENIGAGFVAITDHDHITDLSETEKPSQSVFCRASNIALGKT